uniref:Ig-like domain-containing protein n=1 Tax=Sinocyclocheilus grahami TaxID=75366 RepID=A0A672TGJ2_SINGR
FCEGAQDITTVRQISVRRGQSVIIPCLYDQKYAFSCKYLSAGYYWLLSDYVEFPDQRFHHKTVFISDEASRHSFTVRMDNVQESGYYWSGEILTEIYLNLSDSPGLLVNSQNVTGSENGSVTISCYHQGGQYGVKWCKFGGQCITGASGRLDGASVEIRYGLRNTTVSMSRLKKEHTGWYWCSTEELQMPVHITVHQKKSRESPDTADIYTIIQKLNSFDILLHFRTAILFLLPVILEILLMIIIYLALKLLKFCKKSK